MTKPSRRLRAADTAALKPESGACRRTWQASGAKRRRTRLRQERSRRRNLTLLTPPEAASFVLSKFMHEPKLRASRSDWCDEEGQVDIWRWRSKAPSHQRPVEAY